MLRTRSPGAQSLSSLTTPLHPSCLPSHPSNRSPRPRPHTHLPHLIHYQYPQRQRQRNQPILNRHRRRAKDILDTRLHGDEDGDGERHDDAAEEVGVFARAPEGVGLQDGHALVADGEEVAPLEDYESYAGGVVSFVSGFELGWAESESLQVDALADGVEVSQFVGCIPVETFAVTLEEEEELVDRYTGDLVHVEEEHCVCA